MGTLYYLVKAGKKEYFDLGKGFAGLFEMNKPIEIHQLHTQETLTVAIMDRMTKNYWVQDTVENNKTFANSVAEKVLTWVGLDQVVCMTDATFDSFGEETDSYVKTGSRY